MTLREACFGVSVLFTALAASACSSQDESADRGAAAAPSSSGDMAGGLTSDFTGDQPHCTTIRYESAGDDAALGFSMGSLLGASVGQYDLPLRWNGRCQLHDATACPASEPALEALDGVETVLRVNIQHEGEPAVVRHPSAEQPSCAQDMEIPVQLQLQTDDGVLNENVALSLWSECGRQVSLDLYGPSSMLQGTLASAAQGLGASAQVEITLGFFSDRMWFGLHVVPSEGGFSVFTTDLPPFSESTHDVPRTTVERQPGTPLSAQSCRALSSD
jgi:hypothetical protein